MPAVPAYNDSRDLAANVSESFTVPAGRTYVKVITTAPVFIDAGAVAVVPGDISDGTAAYLVLDKEGFNVAPAEVYSLISESACKVVLSYTN